MSTERADAGVSETVDRARCADELTRAGRAGTEELVGCLDGLATQWLTRSPAVRSLDAALDDGRASWDGTFVSSTMTGPLVYPLLYTCGPRVSTAQFCEITDAAFEAQAAGTEVQVVGVPIGRAMRSGADGEAIRQIVEAWWPLGLPVRTAGQVHDLPGIAARLVDHARRNAFSRRALDLPDLLVAAAASALGASAVYRAQGVVPRRGLGAMATVPPLCTLYGPDPFGDPPPGAKLRPAGSDSLWFLAFTAGLTRQANLGDNRDETARAAREQLARPWNTLRSARLTATRSRQACERPGLRLRLAAGADHDPSLNPVLPVFGSRVVSASSRWLVALAAELLGAQPFTLVVDDISPRYLYADLDPAAARAAWSSVACAAGCEIAFLSDRGPAALADDIVRMLRALSTVDIAAAVPRGLGSRLRGGTTGYDALHLATMAVAASTVADPLVVCRSADVPSVQRLERVLRVRGVLSATGLDAVRRASDVFLESPLPHAARGPSREGHRGSST